MSARGGDASDPHAGQPVESATCSRSDGPGDGPVDP
jgi:hypothetical protein